MQVSEQEGFESTERISLVSSMGASIFGATMLLPRAASAYSRAADLGRCLIAHTVRTQRASTPRSTLPTAAG